MRAHRHPDARSFPERGAPPWHRGASAPGGAAPVEPPRLARALGLPAAWRPDGPSRLRDLVPQIGPADRARLVEQIQGASAWNFDFAALVCLSTLIAGLGLVRDAASVVIGAMVVAPLMTPLVGAGLALVQGDLALIRDAARATLFGFLLVFGIGVALGALLPDRLTTQEMLSRGAPNLLDLGVAFVTGVAAAYASARPKLLAALPGVAIAAALVPPIATSGISLAIGQPWVAAGAAVLFLANVVAIVLGSAACLWMVGVRREDRPEPWARRVLAMLVSLTLVLTVPLSVALLRWLPSDGVPPEVVASLAEEVERANGGRVLEVSRMGRSEPPALEVAIASPYPPSHRLARSLAALAAPHFGTPVQVRIVTRLVSESGPRPGG